MCFVKWGPQAICIWLRCKSMLNYKNKSPPTPASQSSVSAFWPSFWGMLLRNKTENLRMMGPWDLTCIALSFPAFPHSQLLPKAMSLSWKSLLQETFPEAPRKLTSLNHWIYLAIIFFVMVLLSSLHGAGTISSLLSSSTFLTFIKCPIKNS